MEEASGSAEYLINLQLPASSTWLKELLTRRAAVQQEFLADETGLYPPHVSVTGFFSATSKQAAVICSSLWELVNAEPRGFEVELRQILSTESGHVLVDVVAHELAKLASSLAAKASEAGVKLRPKAARHLSLASGRTPEEQRRVQQLYQGLPLGKSSLGCPLELVVAKLLCRSNLERLRREQKAHEFSDLLRIPISALPGAQPAGLLSRLAFQLPLRIFDASTPVRKRPLELGIDDLDLGRDDQTAAGESEITPAKHLKLEPVETPPGKTCKDFPVVTFMRPVGKHVAMKP
mmetsp:Transcript_40601/g.73082  ORF Transcript_40601/g.73082 Transcript_40601/m.73082 type:complete len:292 (+) Transcript_40601:91-966(+)|eukprot:CAMPEP_0197632354 /NCGR_PEP_ID=MMETSP1338-20131121/9147_1 /TAXON_ID=43686 ORGANISM="Pelagodinium beii, Strain RCC1491" /NCGR_SAMPLE_ID=MMETSP1338 /ASSEMBLY_ACC=CAM_ASM_000754 /LENGTH=291 /DNA_ID=CAMNT_0043203917 /DNA_START=89 /DNA_END=964 /DNA_ORIENTATION=+